jgi:ribosomal-protein-alanine N-acetyltransferase
MPANSLLTDAVPPRSIATERLSLRVPAIADAGPIFAEYAQDSDVTRFLSWKPHQRVETVAAYLRQALSGQEKGGLWFWVITFKDSDRPIGMIHAELHDHRFNFGYVLTKRCWGRGFMAEAMRPVVEWALGQDRIHRVWSFCDVENRASARVLEKLAMQKEGILRRFFVHPNVSDAPRDCYVYSRVRT